MSKEAESAGGVPIPARFTPVLKCTRDPCPLDRGFFQVYTYGECALTYMSECSLYQDT
ncbi:MAG: hypothetical protein Kow0063_34800 [Anaerolineae bacterium]